MEVFPVQQGKFLRGIPWRLIASHERQAVVNHSQDLRTLADRGGLSPTEALAVIEDRKWPRVTDGTDEFKLIAYVAAVLN